MIKYKYKQKQYILECWSYDINQNLVFMIGIQHPSTGFSYEPWINLINLMLKDTLFHVI